MYGSISRTSIDGSSRSHIFPHCQTLFLNFHSSAWFLQFCLCPWTFLPVALGWLSPFGSLKTRGLSLIDLNPLSLLVDLIIVSNPLDKLFLGSKKLIEWAYTCPPGLVQKWSSTLHRSVMRRAEYNGSALSSLTLYTVRYLSLQYRLSARLVLGPRPGAGLYSGDQNRYCPCPDGACSWLKKFPSLNGDHRWIKENPLVTQYNVTTATFSLVHLLGSLD